MRVQHIIEHFAWLIIMCERTASKGHRLCEQGQNI
jgi:hypothetical protein